MATILLEIGTEELPASYLPPALLQLAEQARTRLQAEHITFDTVQTWGTPRRIVLLVTEVAERQADTEHEIRGPSTEAAFAVNGMPTQAAIGFARSQGISTSELSIKTTEHGEYVVATFRNEGRPTLDVLSGLFPRLIADLTFPKTMRWGRGLFTFARPIRWLVSMMDTQVAPFTVDDVVAGNESRGHRFLAPGAVPIAAAADYRRIMEENHVLVDPEERRAMIAGQLQTIATQEHASIIDDGSLLEATTFHLEYPTVVRAIFDERFLLLPREVLLQVLRHEQDFFPLAAADGTLQPAFLAVRNGDKAYLSSVREGYESVAQAKLLDALFFYEQDARRPLAERVEDLRGVIFQERLGTLYDKTLRVQTLAGKLATLAALSGPDRAMAERSALLCKADLVSAMVTEHPQLQGVMGGVYARLSGEAEPVAAAISEHYCPRDAGDAIPQTPLGCLVALADKLDTVVACFAVGLTPTVAEDPYALRREAQGVVRILADANLRFALSELFMLAWEGLTIAPLCTEDATRTAFDNFFRQQIETKMAGDALPLSVTRAVLAISADIPADALHRAQALTRLYQDAGQTTMLRVATRLINISRGVAEEPLRPELLQETAERDLYGRYESLASRTQHLAERGDYDELVNLLILLAPAVEAFFSAVQVMTDDPELRAARLSLVAHVARLFRLLADFSAI